MERDLNAVAPGTVVYSSDDENVGEVEQVGSNYLLARKGLFFVKERYIPFDAVSRVDADGVYLNIVKEQLDSMAWDDPPAETTSTLRTTDVAAANVTQTRSDLGTVAADVDTAAEVRADDEMVVPVVEEELRVGKREVEGGGVRVRTHVEEVPVSEQVTLRDEDVQVERVRVDRPISAAEVDALQTGTFEVRETDEEAVVDKRARVVEEITVHKDVVDRTEAVQDTVRRTRVDVDEVAGEITSGTTRAVDSTTDVTMDVDTTSTQSDEGAIERGASKLGNAVEGATGADLDRDGDVGRRDPRNNI